MAADKSKKIYPDDPGDGGFDFIDLFAGIGGFHAALSGLGGNCVYAVEIDEEASAVYARNWGMNPLGDITIDVTEEHVRVPPHDVLTAGFPCQPFSKSGRQRGMDETRGTLFWSILRIIKERRPALVVLENVRNLAGPRHRHEWDVIVRTLREAGYRVAPEPGIFSPHLLPRRLGGRPQVRERVFIVAVRDDGDGSGILSDDSPIVNNRPVENWDPMKWRLSSGLPLLRSKEVEGCSLSDSETLWIDAWNDFVEGIWEVRNGVRLPGFPLWGDNWVTLDKLVIPKDTPKWRSNILRKNAEFYTEHKRYIDKWTKKWDFYSDKFPPSRRKFEWQAQDTPRLWDTVIHLRPSGIRAKRTTYVPALVAITQTSIIGPRKRRLAPREAARLQGLPESFSFGDQANSATYRQLGNGVSVGAVWHVVRQAVEHYKDLLSNTCPGLVDSVLGAAENPDLVL
jgi:DNA (cytosine-5)-methyltransferase 1